MADGILPQCGIYAIRNTINGKRYIGQAARLAERRRQHFRALKNGSHHCEYLQRAYGKYGAGAFVHEIIEICEHSKATEREQFWMDHYRSSGVYNTAKAAGSPLGLKRSSESREKMAAAKRGRKASDETRKKMRESQAAIKELKRENALAQWARPGEIESVSEKRKGKKASDETKAKLSAISLERWRDPEYRAKVSQRTGEVRQTPEYKIAMANRKRKDSSKTDGTPA